MKYIFFVVIIFLAIACNHDRVYEENVEFENAIWYLDTIPAFEFDIEDTQTQYDININIRNSLSYPFQNIYVTYYLEDTTGQQLATELVNFQLFDAKTGKPFGNGGLGDLYDHRFNLFNDYTFPEKGVYRMKIEQYMRRDSLPEIIAVGIHVEKNKTAE